jgi:hypothetical protein
MPTKREIQSTMNLFPDSKSGGVRSLSWILLRKGIKVNEGKGFGPLPSLGFTA